MLMAGLFILGTAAFRQGGYTTLQTTSPKGEISRVASASIALSKTVGLDAETCAQEKEIVIGAGTTVIYCYEITNTGTITLTRHDLVDSHLGAILTNFPFSLAPQASAFLTQSMTITQTTVNSATWTSYNPGPIDVVDTTDAATVTVAPPSIALTKTVGLDAASCALDKEITLEAGTPVSVTYCYRVTNTGLTILRRHNLADSELGTILTDFPFILMPQASAFLTQNATITQTTINSATWTSYNPGPIDVAMATDSATVSVVPPSIVLTKTVGLDASLCASEKEVTIEPGTPVTYCYEIRNVGLTALTRHDLVDSDLGALLNDFPQAIPPQGTTFVTHTAIITQTTVNSATWTAYNPGPTDVAMATDSATVTVVPPSILFTKTVGLDANLCASEKAITVEPGTPVTYCFTVRNTGLTALTQHTLVDSHLGALLEDSTIALSPQESTFLTQTATITQTTINSATWTSYNPGPVDVAIATDSAEVEIMIVGQETYTLSMPLVGKSCSGC
jgi:hypothetical protein